MIAQAPNNQENEDFCPFVNRDDLRCAARLTLGSITRAFTYCAGNYKVCPIYKELIADERNRNQVPARHLTATS